VAAVFSSINARTFGKTSPAPSPGMTIALQSLLKTAPASSPPATSAFFRPAPAMLPNAGAAVANYTPPTMTSTTIPVPSQAPSQAMVPSMFATLNRLSAPRTSNLLPPAPPERAPVAGLTAPPVGTSPGGFVRGILSLGASAITAFNPPSSTPGVSIVGTAPYVGLPPPAPPANQGTTPTGTAPQGTSTAIPDSSGGGSGGGFDPYGSTSGDAASLAAAASAHPDAAAPSSISLTDVALYGGGALLGLYALSKLFGGSRSAA
jgi:hypothetical protein